MSRSSSPDSPEARFQRLPAPMRRLYHRTLRNPARRASWRLRAVLADPIVNTDEGAIAMTFDDGPDPVFTDAVLDVLDRWDVRATFFVVGRNAVRHPRLIRRIIGNGHAIASHSHTHPDPWRLSAKALWSDYRRGHQQVTAVAGQDVRLFRPPKGYIDLRSAAVMRAAGLRPHLWSIDAADWEPGIQPQQVLERLTPVRSGDIVLLHDAIERPISPAAADRSATVEGLDRFLAMAHRADLTFTTLA